ncbi:pentapeptide repeat-containing protein [Variovorax sp. J22G73]|uniref:pentapeptide repeat-containing protein n=1 Tax=unclassified Variovorax TaxID=663243 RepID=UPI000D5D6A29|nr:MULTISPECIES: pentapeptide repeat-containing protein [unclassified Variovorax]MDM0007837.1 pentapeptide repeat-containing protein [Variovorax sp. J22R203]MDM0100540.1 pentapeptide repeat-containing protein [Variovorax sp. J22G73]
MPNTPRTASSYGESFGGTPLKRRVFTSAALLITAFAAQTTGFAMRKSNVRTLDKKWAYLQDPALRARETGDAVLEIRDVEVSGVSFVDASWRNIRFVDCDFVGAYEIKADMEAVEFSNCRFAGIFNFGKLVNVDFLRCSARANTFVVGGVASKGVRFVDCSFTGVDPDPNRWGGMGSYGETEFTRCKMKWTNVISETRHMIVGCDFDTVDCNVSKDGGGSDVWIEKSTLRGMFDMTPATLRSLTIRDTVLEELTLSDAKVKGDVLFERVKASFIDASVASARSLTVRDSEIRGSGRDVSFVMAMDSAQQVLLERSSFGTPMTMKVNLGPGRPLQDDEWRTTPLNELTVIRDCSLPMVDASWLETRHLRFERNTIGSLNISHGRIGKLELVGNTIARSTDFTNTQTRENKVQPFAKGQAKLEGSNINRQATRMPGAVIKGK